MYAGVPSITPADVSAVGIWLTPAPPEPAASPGLRETEVEHLDDAVGPDLDVGGLEVSVDDALLVRGFERIGDLTANLDRFADRQSAASDPLGQRLALDQFEHQCAYGG
jgi:hypothetical protein